MGASMKRLLFSLGLALAAAGPANAGYGKDYITIKEMYRFCTPTAPTKDGAYCAAYISGIMDASMSRSTIYGHRTCIRTSSGSFLSVFDIQHSFVELVRDANIIDNDVEQYKPAAELIMMLLEEIVPCN
jgi:hypothetical protein